MMPNKNWKIVDDGTTPLKQPWGFWKGRLFVVAGIIALLPQQAMAKGPIAPGPAKPMTIPLETRLKMYVTFVEDMSDTFGSRVDVSELKTYEEQDGSLTVCTMGIVRQQFFTLVRSGGKFYPYLTPREWIAAGCERPNAVVLK